LPEITKDYDIKNIFNCDETGLFYRLMPNKTIAYKGENCHGGKQSKERLTVLLCANADGSDKLKPLIIGKAKNPRCFKNVKNLPCKYDSNKNAWMTGNIFLEFLRDLNSRMIREKRNVLLFIDRCPAHPTDLPNLSNIKVIFFPPNCTSKLQPLDLGIIRCMKVSYRKAIVRRAILALELKKSFEQISVLDAIHKVCTAWGEVTTNTIVNCFQKAGFLPKDNAVENNDIETSIEDEDDILEDEDWGVLVDKNGTFKDYVTIDENVLTTGMRDVEEILHEVNDVDGNNEDADINQDLEEVQCVPTFKNAVDGLETVRMYLKNRSTNYSTLTYLNELEKDIFSTRPKSKQLTMLDFVEKKM